MFPGHVSAQKQAKLLLKGAVHKPFKDSLFRNILSGFLTYNRENAQYKTWKTAEAASTHTYRGGIQGEGGKECTGITKSHSA